VKPANGFDMDKIKNELAATGATSSSMLPLFAYNVEASRDQNDYTGVMVGANPFTAGGNKNVSVLTHIVPLIIITQTVGVSVSSTGIISTRRGSTTFDPTAADDFCLNAPNDVPLNLLQQSPLFNPAPFDFGGTIVGTTEYSDAFQRGNFWKVLGDNGTRGRYHTRVDPVQTLKAKRGEWRIRGRERAGGWRSTPVLGSNGFYVAVRFVNRAGQQLAETTVSTRYESI
jgi:hypothetical protein